MLLDISVCCKKRNVKHSFSLAWLGAPYWWILCPALRLFTVSYHRHNESKTNSTPTTYLPLSRFNIHLILICPFAGCMEITWNFICRPLTEETYWHTWGWRVLCGRSEKSSRRGLRNKAIMCRTHNLEGRIGDESAIFPFPISNNWIIFTLSAVLTTVWSARAARLSVQRVVLKLAFWEMEKILWNRCNSVIWKFAQWWPFGDYYLKFAPRLTRSPLKNDIFAAKCSSCH